MRIQDLTELTSIADTDLVVVDDYQSAGVYTTKKITVANLKSELGVKGSVLRLNLSQSGTSAPTFTELENTTGATITASRLTTGTYRIESDLDLFSTPDNVYLMINGYRYPYAFSLYRISSKIIQIQTWIVSTATATDGALNRTSLEIKIYN